MNYPYDQNILNVNMQNNVNTGENPISNENLVDGNQNPINSRKKKKKRKSSIWKEKYLRMMTVVLIFIS